MSKAREILTRIERLSARDDYPDHLDQPGDYSSADFGKIVRQLPIKLSKEAVRELKKVMDKWDKKGLIHSMVWDRGARTWTIYLTDMDYKQGQAFEGDIEEILNASNIEYKDIFYDHDYALIKIIFPIK